MRQKGLVGIFVLVLVLVVAVAGGAYYLGRVSTKSQVNGTTQVTPTTPAPDLYREPNGSAATANWKIYNNRKLGFSMAYPNDWTVEENTITGKTLPGIRIIFQSPADYEHNSNPVADFGRGLFLSVYDKPTTMTIEDFLKKDREISDATFLKWQPFTIGSIKARSYTNLPRCCDGEDIFLDSGGHIFYFADMTDLVMFKTILSTFKFTSQ